MPKSIHVDHHNTASYIPKEFARILRVPCQGVCVLTPDWPISSLPNGVDSNPDIYPPPHEDFLLIRDALFYERPLETRITLMLVSATCSIVSLLENLSILPTTLPKEWKVKRPRPQTLTPTESFESPSPTPHQEEEENDMVDNYTLDPLTYIDQLPPIKGGESSEFKQTKGMFKCFGHFLSNIGKKK
ncbi:hypothetical protein Tco_0120762 [Tanacetum coccineum]